MVLACSSSRSINIIEGCPSFFKIIRYPSAPHLALPDAFVRNYLEKIPKNPILKTATGEHSWKLKFIKIGEDYCFAHGWDKLAKDVQLSIRDIVVFWLTDPFTFQVSFLDANGCSKDLPLNTQTNNGDKNSDCDGDDDALGFEKVISGKTHNYNMLLPLKFVKAAGLESKSSVKMKDHEGKDWSMRIVVEASSGIRYSLTTPWSIFRRSHKLSDGDVCFFKFDKKEGVLHLTKVVRNKKPPQNVTIEKPCDDDDALCFEKVIGKTHKYNMLLPLKFVKAAGLESKSSVKVKDHEGKDWSMRIVVEASSRIRYSLTTPWSIFRRSHQLSDGDVCFFKFDKKEGVLNLTKVVRNKKPPQNVTIEKPCDGGVKVKIEYDSGDEMKVRNRKRALEGPVSGVKVKTEDHGSGSVEAVKRKMRRLSVDEKAKTGQETEKLHICRRVVYF